MVFGLESVKDIDTVLTSANQVREEFRKNFPFPVVLLVNDQVLQKLIRLAADFKNWSTIIPTAIATTDLIKLINQTAESVFAQVLDAGAGKFVDNSALNLAIGSPHRLELESAQAELQTRGVKLDAKLEASLEFVLGRDAVSMEQSRQHYERSLTLWQEISQLEQQGCVLYNLGLWWRTYAVQHLTKQQPACLQAKDYYQKCLEVFEQANRPDLIAKFINALGEVLQKHQKFKIYKTLKVEDEHKVEDGHKSWVYSVSFSHNGKIIATTSNDKTAILWKQDSKGEFRFSKKLRGHNVEVQSVAFSSDDQIIATASDDKTVKLWKLDGTFIRTLSGHSAEILSVSFSPDNKTLALGSADNTVILWHLQQLDSLDQLDDLLAHGCGWLRDYLKNNANLSQSDRHLCDDIK
ncbi:MAG: hypothetical protein KME52_12610 [Desmonostoc geniculatum HA4340-LM1]|jgi:hypothetical protein|nr:hypothetical protein [Desmonostoc geniculatum HA4340-LM1]